MCVCWCVRGAAARVWWAAAGRRALSLPPHARNTNKKNKKNELNKGRVLLGRRRQQVRRLHRLVGARDRRRRRRRGQRRLEGADRQGHELWRAVRARKRARQDGHRARAERRDGALCQQRHRGVPERAAPDARVHEAREGRQVCRLLPRARRLVPRQGRVGRRDAGAARLAR